VPRVAWLGGAATQKGSFLANIFAGGLFWHFIDAGGLFCQKFSFGRVEVAAQQSLVDLFLVKETKLHLLISPLTELVFRDE
jgi:hypothetical protein